MALSLGTNPLFFDSITGASVQGKKRVLAILWVEGIGKDIAADDNFAVTDSNGVMIVSKTAAAAGDELILSFSQPTTWDGLTVSVLDDGVCFIYLDLQDD